MVAHLPPHYLQLVWEATHKSYWRKETLRTFLRRCGVSEAFLATWAETESKRDFLNRMFPKLESLESGVGVVNRMATALAAQIQFPDLEGWEESEKMKADAARAVGALRLYLTKAEEDASDARARTESRKRAEEIRQQQLRQREDLGRLSDRLAALVSQIGTQEGGYAFQTWFYDLVEYFELVHRRPYNVDGRNIDGSLTVDGTTYLVELKFTAEAAGSPDIDVFRRKVESKADNTMGIFVSISGFTDGAVQAASGEKSPLLLFAHEHLYAVLGSAVRLQELVARVRRHASQTGKAFIRISDM